MLQCGLMARSLTIKRVLVACCPTQADNHSRLRARLVEKCAGWHVVEASGARVRESLAERLYGDKAGLDLGSLGAARSKCSAAKILGP